jgi:hypothetical protein
MKITNYFKSKDSYNYLFYSLLRHIYMKTITKEII